MALADVDNIVQDLVIKFANGVEKSVNGALSHIRPALRRLPVDSEGKVTPSPFTDVIVITISQNISASFNTGEYLFRLGGIEFRGIDRIARVIQAHYENTFGGIPRSVDTQVIVLKDTAQRNIKNNLQPSAVINQIVPLVNQVIYEDVRARKTIEQIITNVEVTLHKATQSIIQVQYATTLQTYVRALSEVFAASFRLVWVKYRGPRDEANREFCQERINDYYHIEEVKAWGRGQTTGDLIWPDFEGHWAGKIPTTNMNNIITILGGYNCRHFLEYVKADQVPNNVKTRVINSGIRQVE